MHINHRVKKRMFEENTQSGQTQGAASVPVIPQPTVMLAAAGSHAGEPHDMFEGADQSASAQGYGAAGSVPLMQVADEGSTKSQSSMEGYRFEEEPKPWYAQKKFIILILGVVLALIIVIFGVQFALRFFTPSAPALPDIMTNEPLQEQPVQGVAPVTPETIQPQETTQTSPAEIQQEAASAVQQQQTAPTQQPQAGETDTDTDGLLDSEEQAIGTDINLSDTDSDGLTDREEFRVFGTDPLEPDTDGDSYLDGAEVQNGYNPKGEGKLFTIPTE